MSFTHLLVSVVDHEPQEWLALSNIGEVSKEQLVNDSSGRGLDQRVGVFEVARDPGQCATISYDAEQLDSAASDLEIAAAQVDLVAALHPRPGVNLPQYRTGELAPGCARDVVVHRGAEDVRPGDPLKGEASKLTPGVLVSGLPNRAQGSGEACPVDRQRMSGLLRQPNGPWLSCKSPRRVQSPGPRAPTSGCRLSRGRGPRTLSSQSASTGSCQLQSVGRLSGLA